MFRFSRRVFSNVLVSGSEALAKLRLSSKSIVTQEQIELLRNAVNCRRVDVIANAARAGIDVNQIRDKVLGAPLLFDAVETLDVALVKTVLDAGALLSTRHAVTGDTVFHRVHLIMALGANVHQCQKMIQFLEAECTRQNLDISSWPNFFGDFADPSIKQSGGSKGLHRRFVEHQSVAPPGYGYLQSQHPGATPGQLLFHARRACADELKDKELVVKYLLADQSKLNLPNGLTPLLIAAYLHDVELISELLSKSKGGIDINQSWLPEGLTVLDMARLGWVHQLGTAESYSKTRKLLIDVGAMPSRCVLTQALFEKGKGLKLLAM